MSSEAADKDNTNNDANSSNILNGVLDITIHRGEDLHSVSILKMAPYIQLRLQEKLLRTSEPCKGAGKCPIFEERVVIQLNDTPDTALRLDVYNKELVNDDKIGEFVLTLQTLIKYAGKRQLVQLINSNSERRGMVELTVNYTPHALPQKSNDYVFTIQQQDSPTSYLCWHNKALQWKTLDDPNQLDQHYYFYFTTNSNIIHYSTKLMLSPPPNQDKEKPEISLGLSEYNTMSDTGDFVWLIIPKDIQSNGIGNLVSDFYLPSGINKSLFLQHSNSGKYLVSSTKDSIPHLNNHSQSLILNFISMNDTSKSNSSTNTSTDSPNLFKIINKYTNNYLVPKNFKATHENLLMWNNGMKHDNDCNLFYINKDNYLVHHSSGLYIHPLLKDSKIANNANSTTLYDDQLVTANGVGETAIWTLEEDKKNQVFYLKNKKSNLYLGEIDNEIVLSTVPTPLIIKFSYEANLSSPLLINAPIVWLYDVGTYASYDNTCMNCNIRYIKMKKPSSIHCDAAFAFRLIKSDDEYHKDCYYIESVAERGYYLGVYGPSSDFDYNYDLIGISNEKKELFHLDCVNGSLTHVKKRYKVTLIQWETRKCTVLMLKEYAKDSWIFKF